jgi:RNA polymerase sigma-70 factor (ECF subfamily)
MTELPTIADDALIERILGGDGDAFAQLVERHQRQIYRTALAIVRNEVEAETITQDTFVQAYLKLSKFERRSELETWLTRIAINRARDLLRRRKWISLTGFAEEEETAMQIVDDAPDAERNVASREMSEAIEKAVESLSVQQKLIFRLRHFEDRSLEEIARLLKLQPGTVRAHLFRAVHKVRQQLAGWMSPALRRAETSDETF